MIQIRDLPIEIHQLIGLHLEPQDYHKYRISFTGIPEKHRIFPSRFQRQTRFYSLERCPERWIEIEPGFVRPQVGCEISRFLIRQLIYSFPQWNQILTNLLFSSIDWFRTEKDLGGCCLEWACITNDIKLTRLLLYSQRVFIDKTHLSSAFFEVCDSSNSRLIRIFLRGTTLESQDKKRATCKFNVVKTLSKSEYHCVLEYAIYFCDLEIVELLMQDRALYTEEVFMNCLRRWNEKPKSELQWKKISEMIRPDAMNNYPIRSACAMGRLETVKILLEDPRVDPSTFDNECIREASKHGHLEVVKVLLKDKRVDPGSKENNAIKQALKNGHFEIVRLLEAYNRIKVE